jgi:sucrose-6-phosphate hydrolase SacC (GH32 family)
VATIDPLMIKLKNLTDTGHAKDDYVQWGRGKRNVVMIGGKKYQYKKGKYLVYSKIK